MKTRDPGRTGSEGADDAHIADDDPDPQDVPAVRYRVSDPLPSESQRFEHSITHLPFKTWCPVCVGARGRNDMHRRVTASTTQVPLVAFDFAFFRESRGTTNVPVLVAVDKDSGCVAALALPSKSSFPLWLAPLIARIIDLLAIMVS